MNHLIRSFPWAQRDKRFLVRFAYFCAAETVLEDGRPMLAIQKPHGLTALALVKDWIDGKDVSVQKLRDAAIDAWKDWRAAYAADAYASAYAYAAADAAAPSQQVAWLLKHAPKKFKCQLLNLCLGVEVQV